VGPEVTEAIKAVLRRDLPPREKHVLTVYAIHADKDGFAYPGIKTVAEETGLGRSTVCRAITALIACGELIETCRGGGRRSTTYQLGCMAKTLPLFAKQISEITESESPNGTAAVPKLDTAAVPERDGSCPKSPPAIRKESTYNNHVTDIEGGMQNQPPLSEPPSSEPFEFDAAVQECLVEFSVRGSGWRKMFADCVTAAIRTFRLPPLRAPAHMHAEFDRYRGLGGDRKLWYFLSDLYCKPDSEWELNGAHANSSNQTRSAYGRKLAALDALFADTKEIPTGADGDTGEPAGRPGG
jgi:hypothetical protein